MMKKYVLLFTTLLLTRIAFPEPLASELGPETVLVESGETGEHIAFPHAAADDEGHVWMVYRKARTHAGSLGTLCLVQYRLSDMAVLRQKEIYSSGEFDPRDPTVSYRDGILFISFFQYNYTFNMVRQFILTLSAETLAPAGSLTMLKNTSILNHSSASPLIRHEGRWILPVYYVDGFSSVTTDVGFFSFARAQTDADGTEVTLTRIASGSPFKSFFLEPSLAVQGDHWIALFRTSPASVGPGGVAPMLGSESFDGGKSWGPPQRTAFLGHHPRMSVDARGRIWAGFRDLSGYTPSSYKAKITLWQMNGEKDGTFTGAERTVTVFETREPDPGNWDCGYPSLIQLDADTFRVIYYYAHRGKYRIASRTVKVN